MFLANITHTSNFYKNIVWGDAAWDALSDAERAEKLRVHQLDCWQHLRNIMLSAMSTAQVSAVRNRFVIVTR